MKLNHTTILLASAALSLFGCKKDEPYEYPDGPANPSEQLIVYFDRSIAAGEKWTGSDTAYGCPGNPNVQNLAFHEINIDRGFANMHLVPNSDSCVLDVSLTSEIKSSEVTQRKWEDLTFEFTYSEYSANPGTQFWLSLYYSDLELDLDLAPHIIRWVPSDVNNGVFKMSFDSTGVIFQINGKRFTPEFDNDGGNHFSTSGSGEKQYVRTRLHSEETDQQSFLEFKYLRISRYGIPES